MGREGARRLNQSIVFGHLDYRKREKKYYVTTPSKKASRATPPVCVTHVPLTRSASLEKLSAGLKRGFGSSARLRGTAGHLA